MQEHIEITEMRASLEPVDGSGDLRLAIHALEVRLHRAGLDLLVRHLVPEVTVAVTLEDPAGGTGIDLLVQATQWGMRPRVRVQLRLEEREPPTVRIDLEVGSRWSPLDWTMLRIMRDKLRGLGRSRPELSENGSQSFRVDVRRLIEDLIAGGGAPVRWDARLATIHSSADSLAIRFSPEVPDHGAV